MGITKFNVGRVLTKAEYAELKEWIKTANRDRHRNGDRRDDGRVFCGYGYGYVNGEYWASEETFNKRLSHCASKMMQLRKDPEYRAKYNEYCRKRYASSHTVKVEMKKRAEKYRAKPESKQKIRDYSKSWSKNNHEHYISLIKSRTLKKKNQLHPEHDKSIEMGLRKRCKQLKLETGCKHDVDHIIPIAAGGWHHHANLQILPFDENQKKKANPFYVSTKYRDFRSVPRELWPEQLIDAYLAIMTT